MIRRIAVLLALSPLLMTSFQNAAFADYSFDGTFTTGQGYRGYQMETFADLDGGANWNGNLTYAYAHSEVGTPSLSRQITAGFTHVMDGEWKSRASFTGWYDNINDVWYVGPSAGLTYTDYEGSGDDKVEVFRSSFDNNLYIYQAEETKNPRTIKISRKVTETIPAGQGGVSDGQWQPTLEVEKPFWGKFMTPSVTASHYFYTRNPVVIEQRAGQPNFSSSANSLNGLVGGFFNNSFVAGLKFELPATIMIKGSLGTEQLSSDNTWSTTQSLKVYASPMDKIDLSAGWSRSISDGVPQDLFSIDATLTF
jgi:hypothetical protein